MSKLVDIETIKKKIERLKAEMRGLEPHSDFRKGQIASYNQVLSFIESIEQEHVSENEKSGTCEPSAREINFVSKEPKIKGWVARDKNGALYLHNDKPLQTMTLWTSATYIVLSADMFPELSFEDEPIEVELSIEKV